MTDRTGHREKDYIICLHREKSAQVSQVRGRTSWFFRYSYRRFPLQQSPSRDRHAGFTGMNECTPDPVQRVGLWKLLESCLYRFEGKITYFVLWHRYVYNRDSSIILRQTGCARVAFRVWITWAQHCYESVQEKAEWAALGKEFCHDKDPQRTFMISQKYYIAGNRWIWIIWRPRGHANHFNNTAV